MVEVPLLAHSLHEYRANHAAPADDADLHHQRFSATARPISCVLTCLIPAVYMSAVRNPAPSTRLTARSIRSAACGWPSEYRSIIAAERMVASGLATPLPAMSGAEP